MIKLPESIKPLIPLLRLYPWAMPVIVTLGILSSLSEGLGISLFIPLLQSLQQANTGTSNSFFFVNAFDRLLTQVASDYRFIVIAALIFGSILVKNILAYSNTAVFSWLNSRITHRLRSGVFDQLLNVSYSFFEGQESGKLLNTLATETWQTGKALSLLVNLIISVCTILVFVVLMVLISWQLTLLVGTAMLLISLTIHVVARNAKLYGQQAVQLNKVLASRMWEGFGGMKVIRLFGREADEQERFDHASIKVRDVFLQLDLLSGIVNPLSEILSALLLLCILVIALLQNQAALPTLLTFIFILYRLQPKVKQFDSARITLMSLTSSVEDVMSFLERSDKPYIHSGHSAFQRLETGISFEAVGFCYQAQEEPALQDISFCIPRGKTTALVGPSGAGKSTLLNLICRFYDPTVGQICVDHRPLQQLNLHDWRSRIAVVSQDVYLFSGTIRENIAYGRSPVTDHEVITAARLANADEFITQLPYGYETKVGDRGIRLSGGQRQRIALARAIVRNPDILILDEATNALDSISENLIQEALNTLSKDRTVIVVAHRLSTIEEADQIIVLERGRVVEQGNLQDLLKRNGLFTNLYNLQYRNTQACEN
ncbi:ABC transporter ATP-binding protein [Oculatella sp. LEGE 06141]|nr:ABC transporter ATP-binding protein [Oculatella sp. LEGE 06141]